MRGSGVQIPPKAPTFFLTRPKDSIYYCTMKTQAIANPLISSDSMESSIMGMDSRGSEIATFYLRDKIYSDKILAVVREYASNALDEHKKHKIQKPVSMGLRVEGAEHQFYVRDFANGLSEFDIRNIFGMYFRSTKNKDNTQIGGFGIGSKAGHAYTDTFYVKSFHQGVCSMYACSLGGGNTGVPVGHIFKVSEHPTDQTGIEISLPIKSQDLESFRTHMYSFVLFSSMPIEFSEDNNSSVTKPLTPKSILSKNGFDFYIYKLWEDDAPFDYQKEKAIAKAYFHSRFEGNVFLKTGNVTYARCDDDLNFKSFRNHLNTKFKIGSNIVMAIHIPIGKMSLPISRENFEDTPQNHRVIEQLISTLNEICDEEYSKVKPMSFEEMIADKESSFIKSENYFSFKKSEILGGDTYRFVQSTYNVNDSSINKVNNKPVLARLPNNANLSYWHDALRNHCKNTNQNFFYVSGSVLDNLSENTLSKIEDYFDVKPVRSKYFKWTVCPKGTADFNTAYELYISNPNYYRPTNSKLSALALHNKMLESLGEKPVKTPEEAQKIFENKELIKHHFGLFSIKNINGNSLLQRVNYHQTRSIKLINNLIALGWFNADSDEYKALQKELDSLSNLNTGSVELVGYMGKIFPKDYLNQKKYDKFFRASQSRFEKYNRWIHKVIEGLLKEDSFRGRALCLIDIGFRYSYHGKQKFTRQDLRKILRTK